MLMIGVITTLMHDKSIYMLECVLEHLKELEAKQQAERKAYFENPVNVERPLRAVGGTRCSGRTRH